MTFDTRATTELAVRAKHLLGRKYLAIDYYRIHTKIGVPLPVTGLMDTDVPVRGFSAAYPWSIWLLWALEDRLVALGEHVEATGDLAAMAVVERELLVFTQWPDFRCGSRIDLPCSHAMRILWIALTQWQWISFALRAALRQTLERIVQDVLHFSDKDFGQYESVLQLMQDGAPSQRLHNIPVIGSCMLALAARTVAHPAADRLDARVHVLLTAILEWRSQGLTEGVSYDGYVLDFAADWLLAQVPSIRDSIAAHDSFKGWCCQVVDLAVPGDVMGTAPLGDVEPVEMPFVWSALSKLHTFCGGMTGVLLELDVSRLRADALKVWRRMSEGAERGDGVRGGWGRTPHAVALRSGPGDDQFTAVVGTSTSSMGHIQADAGSLVLGMRKRWWIDDPGYQQYAKTSEREFTIGPSAHNTPVINGFGQVFKRAQLTLDPAVVDDRGTVVLALDLTACYEPQAGLKRLERTVWMMGAGNHLIVCDLIQADSHARVDWNWHGHPDLYWVLRKDSVLLMADDDAGSVLHIMSPQLAVASANIQSLPGSRGQKTLVASAFIPGLVAVWWVFSRGVTAPACELQGEQFVVDGQVVPLTDKLANVSRSLSPLPTEAPSLQVTAVRKGKIVTAVCHVNVKRFPGDLEFAFYLMSGESKLQVQWYGSSSQVELQIPDGTEVAALKVHGFVRDRAVHSRKLMKVVPVLD